MPDEEEKTPVVTVVVYVAYPSLSVTLTGQPPNRKARRKGRIALRGRVVLKPGVVVTLEHPYIEAPIPVQRIVTLAREKFNDHRIDAVEIWVDQAERYRWSLKTQNNNDASNGDSDE